MNQQAKIEQNLNQNKVNFVEIVINHHFPITGNLELEKIFKKVQELNHPLDAVVVIGHNWARPKINRTEGDMKVFELSIQSKINALIGLFLYKLGLTNKVIYSSGPTAGTNHPSEGAEMLKFAQDFAFKYKLGQLPISDFILEEKSLDTSENATFTHIIMEEQGLKHSGIVGISYHVERANRYFKNLKEIEININSEYLLNDLANFFAKYWVMVFVKPENSLLRLLAASSTIFPTMLKEHDSVNKDLKNYWIRYGPGYNSFVVPLATAILGEKFMNQKAHERANKSDAN